MQETLKQLKLHNVNQNFSYHPQSNARVERYHRTLNAVLGKFLVGQKSNIWDLFLPQALAAIRFNLLLITMCFVPINITGPSTRGE